MWVFALHDRWSTYIFNDRCSTMTLIIFLHSTVILSQSPLLRHLMAMTPPHQPLWIGVHPDGSSNEEETGITDEGISICIGWMYGEWLWRLWRDSAGGIIGSQADSSPSIVTQITKTTASYPLSLIHSNNASSILLAAQYLSLPSLASHAYDVCKTTISMETVGCWVEWCELQEMRMGKGKEVGWENEVVEGDYLGMLKMDVWVAIWILGGLCPMQTVVAAELRCVV